MNTPLSSLPRRDFLKAGAASLAAVVSGGPSPFASVLQAAGPPAARKSIGIQVGAVSFVDEGTDKVLDLLRDRGAIDTIYLTTFTYGRGLAGRQIPGHPFPDHGSQESDEKTFHGGNYAIPHPEFYRNTVLKQTRAPDHGDLDIVAQVLPAAKKRGMRVICSIEDVFRSDVPGVKEVAEVDLQGRRTGTLCLCHPDVRAFWTGLATDLCKSYDIDGILFFNERNGPLLNALGASHAQSIASSRVTCFCEPHQRAAKARGIDFERARQGYQKLDQFIQAALKGQRPSDGYFVEFWRLLVEWPEVIAWDRLFDTAKHQVLAEVNTAVKHVRPGLQVGFHIEHINSFNPIFRATRSYADLATAGLSPDYVFRETQRALAGVQGKCRILPGIDIGIPTGKNSRKASPEDTYAAVAAALKAGAHGLILSRKYSEMQLANLAAAGRAVRDAAKR